MKVVILAGGFGSRLSEETIIKPKPMVKINKKPFLWYIMKYYSYYGQNNFIICAGYKWLFIKKYFQNKSIKIETLIFKKEKIQKYWTKEGWSVIVVNTGLNTMTGGRIKKISFLLNNDEKFLLTYGDGITNANLKKIIKFHKSHKKLATVLAVQPPARFGSLKIQNNFVKKFTEKLKGSDGWINGGFFVLSKKVIKFIKSDKTVWEKEPLKKISKLKELKAYKHSSLWMAMDTLRDKKNIETTLKKKKWHIFR
jgi:glucose-1-phosphate cytidylyltransferase